MNVFSYSHCVTNVPKSQPSDHPTRTSLQCGSVCARREHKVVQEYARILEVNWRKPIQDSELSLMTRSWSDCHPKWKCHHRHAVLWLELLHSHWSCTVGRSISALGWTWWWTWVPRLFRYCDRVCGPHWLEAGMWTPIRAPSPIVFTSTFGYFFWPSLFCYTW